jgi:MFS family permease
MNVALDAGLLRRRPEFRRLLVAQLVSQVGSELALVALPVEVYRTTGSTVAVGALGITEFVPIVALALIGGHLADRLDRRRLIQGSEIAAALVMAALIAVPRTWMLFAASALLAAVTAIRRPPLDALTPRLVERDELEAATAVIWTVLNLALVGGPVLAGVLIAGVSFASVYAVGVGAFVLAWLALARVKTPPPPEALADGGILDGVRYARSRQDLLGSYLVDVNAMFFGMPLALFPALAERFGGGAVVGFMYAAPGVGVVLAMVTSGWSQRVRRHGRAIVYASIGWGVAIALFGLSHQLWLALLFLVLAGSADAVSGLFRSVLWNATIPDHLRGRLAGLEMISWSSGPTLGNAEAGLAASLVGLRGSVVGGGLLCVAGAIGLAAALPRFWRYEAGGGGVDDAEALAEGEAHVRA